MENQEYMFYTLQQQFMQTSTLVLSTLCISLIDSGVYRENKHTGKIMEIVGKSLSFITEKEHIAEKERECLATHLALQMSGIDA